MAHTNSTSNYSLSQFLGTDKPTFLGDYNGDMLKIDAAIKSAADAAEGAVTTANAASELATAASTTAASAASDASTASATATTALNTANNATTAANSASATATSAASDAATALSTANTASATATAAASAVASKPSYDDVFNRMFTMTSDDCVFTPTSGFTVAQNTIKVAKNADVSLGKIYGILGLNCTQGSGSYTLGSFAAGFGNRDAAFNIAGIYGKIRISGVDKDYPCEMVINTDGTISIPLSIPANVDFIQIFFPPCLYVLEDFGD